MTKTVLVTGGSGAIGGAIVERFRASGTRVIVADRIGTTSEDFLQFDAECLGDLEIFAQGLRTMTRTLNHAVFCHGGAGPDEQRPFSETPRDVIAQSVMRNLTSHLVLMSSLLPMVAASDDEMKSVTLMSSINAYKGYGNPAYSAAKSGLIAVVRALAAEVGARGIRINAVAPGTVRTPRTESLGYDFDAAAAKAPLRRLTRARDVADAVHALCALRAVTGQTLIVDSGQLAVE
jgi:NAD(P)-dependent dehydrogenase (short-subunit alcohol dehydrogenase family)